MFDTCPGVTTAALSLKCASLVAALLASTALPADAAAQVLRRPAQGTPLQQPSQPVRARPVAPATQCPADLEAARRAGTPIPVACVTQREAPLRTQLRVPVQPRTDSTPAPVRVAPQRRDAPLLSPDRQVPRRETPLVSPQREAPVTGTPGRLTREIPATLDAPLRQRREAPVTGGTAVTPMPRIREEAPLRAAPLRETGPARVPTDEVRRVPERRAPDGGPVIGQPVRPVVQGRPPVTGGPVTGGNANVPKTVAVGQVHCVVPRATSTMTMADTTQKMLCGFPGPAKAMTFRLTAKQWGQVQQSYMDGFASRIDYGEQENGAYRVAAVAESYQARQKAVCVPIAATYNSNLSIPAKGQTANTHELWCTADGKVVKPVDMGWFDGSMLTELRNLQVEKGPIEVSWFHVTTPVTLDTVRQLPLYPRARSFAPDITAISDKARVDAQTYASQQGYTLTYAEPPLTGRVRLCNPATASYQQGRCHGYFQTGQSTRRGVYNAYATPAVANAGSRTAPKDHSVEVTFSVLPGIIPPQFRARAGGACRVLVGVDVTIKRIQGPSGYNDPRLNAPPPPGVTVGTSSGNPDSKPTPETPPLQDSCQGE